MGFEIFRQDARTVAAVERKLAVISEAVVRLGDQGPELCPGLPWHNIHGLRNWLRRQYDRVDVDTIWQTIAQDLPPLQASVKASLSRLADAKSE